MKRINTNKVFLTLAVLLLVSMLIAIASGAVNISFVEVIKIILSSVFSNGEMSQNLSAPYESIILDIRIPRVFLAAIIGGVLALSGATMQGLFRNPLADPSLIGVTAGASLGASIMIVISASYGSAWLGLPILSLGAFLGGVLAVALVYRLASSTYGTSVATMLLAGIGITALASSVSGLLEFYADNEMLRRISLWRMGGLDGATYSTVFIAAIIGLFMLILLPRYSVALNALLLGESEAKHLGINTESLKKQIIVLVAAGVGVSVALAGTIAFIGLVVPHILRLLIGPDHRYLLPTSALAGAILLVVADNIARVIVAPTELPVGLVTALVGVPFFISLLTRRHVYGLS
ncbi:MAG: iron complex transport system permease protein [Cellvibrionaceae bacterium]|jgi:iron complex transport system permease protein